MKHFFAFLFCIILAVPAWADVPTPDSAMSFSMNKDPKKWESAHMAGNETGIIMEFVPKGDSIDSWKEMVEQQIVFTDIPVRKLVDSFKKMFLKADSRIDIREETITDGSLLLTYTTYPADESGMRRFIQGKDGIYMLAYHVRPKLKDNRRFKLWDDILRKARLVPNPVKKN
ncbi:MAG: hypothetical protein HGB11_13360 [Chlorobiales bacterium]|nr:hypothetical protein [Chlorobiales bacterium]